MALQGSDHALMYALAGLARSGATRAAYVYRLPQIGIGGDWTGPTAARRVLVASLSIADLLNETPNTCTFTVQGIRPVEGSDVVIGMGSRAANPRLFGGTVLRVQQIIAGQNPSNPKNLLYHVEAIDYTWGLTTRLVSARYRSQSATAIANDLITRFAPAGYTSKVTAGLDPIDEITFTNTALMDCLTQLAGRIGGYAKCDYSRGIWLWTTLPPGLVPPPRPLTADHPSLEAISYTRDLSPVVTRALVEGGGVSALEECTPGETRIPVEDNAWFDPAGGYVVSGPQRIRYTGLVNAGGGAMASAVGGATGNTAPSAAPAVTTSPGAGLPPGGYMYAYTWTTASGECLPSPMAYFNAGAAGGPPAALQATPAAGTGLGTGTYTYAYTWRTSALGETVASPLAVADTSATTVGAPVNGPTVTPQAGAGLPNGTYKYAVTFATGGGETTPGPLTSATTSSSTSSSSIPNPTAGPSNLHAQAGAGLGTGTYTYGYTFVDSHGETQASPGATVVTSAPLMAPPSAACTARPVASPGSVTGSALYKYTFVTAAGETTASPMSNTAVASVPSYFVLEGIQIGPPGTTARNIYRTTLDGQGPFRFCVSISNSGTTTSEGRPDNQLGAQEPGSNTAETNITRQVMVDGIATGPSGTTARKVYRSPVNGGAGNLKYLATINNNTGTQLGVDTVPDGSLGAAPPSSNTTGSSSTTYLQQVALTGIPLGPAGVTARKVYRTTTGGSQLKLLTTIANNTATTAGIDTAADASLGANAPTANTTTIVANTVALAAIAAGPAGTTGRNLYRTGVNGGGGLRFLATIPDNTTTTYTDANPDSGLGAAPPTTSTVSLALAVLGSISVGPSGTTGRKVYRTGVNGAGGLKFLATIANNTGTTLPADQVPDASLGAAVPATDTSGLVGGAGGQVNAGATTIPVASVAPFSPEGWALVGGQLIRYKSVSGTALTGIPATGIGSLGVSIPYSSPITVLSQIVGIPASGAGAIVERILQGDPVNLLVIHDDLEAQGILKALLGGAADGVVEQYDQDRRISRIEAAARADAWLALKSHVLESIRYRVRDPLTQSGATVTVDLPSIEVGGTFQIQDVTIAGFLGVATVEPTYDVVASSSRFTFEDLVRRLRTAGG